MIEKYNKLVDEIVKEFTKRYYKELFNEYEYEYDIMDYQGIKQGPVYICAEYYSIDDILITIKHNIPMKIVQKWYSNTLEEKEKINLYNFWRREKDNKKYYEDEFESLKESERKVEKAKELFFKILKNE